MTTELYILKFRVVDKTLFELGNYSHIFQELGIQNIDGVPLPTVLYDI